MKHLIILASIFTVTLAIGNLHGVFKPRLPSSGKYAKAHSYSTVKGTIEQRLDNFDNHNPARFNQRYFMNGEHFQPDGPLIIFIGGEWEATPWVLADSLPTELAEENEGYLFYLEHRFYGSSVPEGNLTTEVLKYLTADQALADIAHFINYIKQTYVIPGTENAHVILVGSHYGGSLAAWFRQKYPHLAVAAWASSAPLLAKVNYLEFNELSGAAYRVFGGDVCYNRLQDAFGEFENLTANGKLDELSHRFNLCQNLTTTNDVQFFFSAISQIFTYLVQYEDDWLIPLDDVCEELGAERTPAEAVVKIVKTLFLDSKCIPINYEKYVEFTRDTNNESLAVTESIRQWSYQLCDQFGWYHSSASRAQPFGNSFPVELFYHFCESVFGSDFTRDAIDSNVERHNTLHGGLDLDVSNVLFTHGQFDPWRSVGVQNQLHNSTTMIIPGVSHSKDLEGFSGFDSPALQQAKEDILKLMHKWLAHASGVDVVPAN